MAAAARPHITQVQQGGTPVAVPRQASEEKKQMVAEHIGQLNRGGHTTESFNKAMTKDTKDLVKG